jgi:hypothetical protein
MHTGRDRLVPAQFFGEGAAAISARISLPVSGRASRDCCHAAVAVSLTGSRTVLSPKSATRSSRPPRAST